MSQAGVINISGGGGGGTPIETITTEDGTVLIPVANNINLYGNNPSNNGYGSYTTGSGNTGKVNSYGVSKWVVNQTAGIGTHTTIASALATAVSGETIFITPGTYIEDLTLKAGVNLCAFDCDAMTPNVKIVGKLTASFSGVCSITGIYLQTNSDFALVVSGSSITTVNLMSCYIDCLNHTGINYTSSNASSLINIYYCLGDLGTTGIAFFSISSSGLINIFFSDITNSGNSTTANTASAGSLYIQYTRFASPITTSGTNTLVLKYLNLSTVGVNITSLTCGGSGLNDIHLSRIQSGTASAISISSNLIITASELNSSNANVITGAGKITYGTLNFQNGSTISTTTQVPYVSSNVAVTVVTPGSYPYTTVPQDYLIKVDTSSARTIIPLASPTTGQVHVIKDTVGSAAANNITVTPSGKNIDGAASFIINSNYGSINIVYNGTDWSVT